MRNLGTAIVVLGLLGACAPSKNTPLGDIAKLTKLDDVMDNQSTTADPQFAKIGASTYADADFAGFAAAAERLSATSLKIKDFASGRAEFEAFAAKLHDKAGALAAAATAKDAAAAKAALTEMKATCKECHSKFR
jgi:cytochrome c556